MAKIMIVDDEQDMLFVIRSLLTSMGYDVVGLASSGEQAVQMARDLKPDLILMDIKMPGHLDGIAAAEQIRLELDIAIVFLTGYATQEYIERAKRVEPFGYVMKPFSNDGLLASIEIALCKNEIQKKQKKSHKELNKLNKKLETEIEAREKSEKKYKFLAENMVDIVWTVDRNLQTTYASPSIEKILGFTPEERKRQPLEEILTPDSLQKVQERLMEEIQRDKEGSADLDRSITMELQYYRRDGSTVWMENRVKMIRDPGNAFDGIIGVSRDITNRKKAEEALWESEERYRTIFNNSPIGIFRSTFEGRFLDVNPSLADMLGYDSPEDVIKNIYSISEQIYVGDEKRQEIVSDQLQSKDVTCHLNRYRRKDGSEFIANLYLKTVRDVEDKPVFLEGIVENITERKQAEDALIESEERFRALFNTASEGILVAELKSKQFHFANPAICQMLGYSEDELIGMNVTDIHPEESLGHVISEFEALARGEKILAPGIPCRRKYGQIIYADVNSGKAEIQGVEYNVGLFTDITERRRAEEALRESEEKHRRLFETMAQGVVYQAADGSIISANPASERILGLSSEQMRGKTSMDPRWKMIKEDGKEVPGTDHPSISALRTGEIVGPVIRGVFRPDKNDHVWLSITAIPLFEPGQTKPYQVYATFEDVTEHKRAEEALRDSQTELSRTLEATTDGIWSWHFKRNELNFSPKYCTMLGYEVDEFPATYENWANLIHPDDRDEVLSFAEEFLRTKPVLYEKEFRLITKDGGYRWIKSRGRVVERDENGEAVYMIGNHEDITDRKQAEEAILESESQYRELVQNANSAIIRYQSDGTITFFNEYAQRLFGYSPEEVVGKHVGILVPEQDSSGMDLTGLVQDVIENPHRHINKINENVCRDGRRVWVNWTNRAILDKNGRVAEILTVGSDITERKKMEEQLQRTQKMEAIGTLTGGIAHDYNNLMSIIMGNLSMAQEEMEPGSLPADFLSEATAAALKVRDLTHELMALSRGGKPVKEVGPLNELLKSALDAIPADSRISVNEVISQDLWQVPHDSYKTGAVFRNVVTNAVEAMPDGGTLTIKAENLTVEDKDPDLPLDPGDFVHISIQDQGKGIPEEQMDKIFDPYFSSKERGVQRGMGLGLSTAYAIIKQHQGHVLIDSSPGVGTTVNIYLPAENQLEQMDSPVTSADNETSPVKRVLVMDDEEMLRNLARQMLVRLGYIVETVKDGLEAIEKYKQQKDSSEPFDAVILDLTIKGGMGGEQTMRELLKIDPDVKAIVSSGYFNDPVMSDFKKYGFMGALAKPYQKTDLESFLKTIL